VLLMQIGLSPRAVLGSIKISPSCLKRRFR
jgi:hypothetical protein